MKTTKIIFAVVAVVRLQHLQIVVHSVPSLAAEALHRRKEREANVAADGLVGLEDVRQRVGDVVLARRRAAREHHRRTHRERRHLRERGEESVPGSR